MMLLMVTAASRSAGQATCSVFSTAPEVSYIGCGGDQGSMYEIAYPLDSFVNTGSGCAFVAAVPAWTTWEPLPNGDWSLQPPGSKYALVSGACSWLGGTKSHPFTLTSSAGNPLPNFLPGTPMRLDYVIAKSDGSAFGWDFKFICQRGVSHFTIPNAIAGPTSQTACSGQSIVLGVSAPAAQSFQWWYRDAVGGAAVPIAGAVHSTYEIPSVSSGSAGTYWAIVTYMTGPGPCAPVKTNELALAVVTGPTASTSFLGPGCGAGAVASLLLGTPPILGGPMKLTLANAEPNSIGALFLSVGDVAPFPVGGGCTAYLNPASLVLITTFTSDPGGNWSLSLPSPASVAGVPIDLQAAIVGPSQAPEVTNGLRIRIG